MAGIWSSQWLTRRQVRGSNRRATRGADGRRRRLSFEWLEQRAMLAALDITGTVLTLSVGGDEQWLVGGNSLDGGSGVPLYFQSLVGFSDVSLSGDAATYFAVSSSDHTDDTAALKTGETLDFVTSIVIADSDLGHDGYLTLGDGTHTLPNLGASFSVAATITGVTISSSVNTGAANQDYACPTTLDGTVTLTANNIAFGGNINGAGGNDRLTIQATGTLAFDGTIGQTTALDYLAITVDSGDLMLPAININGVSSDLRIHASEGVTQSGAITGTTTFTLFAGTGTLDQANTYSGQTTVVDGTLNLNRAGGAAIAGNLVIGDGTGAVSSATVTLLASDQLATTAEVGLGLDGEFDLNGFDQTIAGLEMTGGRVSTGVGTLALGGDVVSAAATSQAAIYGNLDLGGSARIFDVAHSDLPVGLLVAAVITNGNLDKRGEGTLELNGANLFTGNVMVTAGTLLLTNDAALGTGVGTTHVAAGATLALSGVTIEENLEFDSTVGLSAEGEASSVISGDVLLLSGLGVVLDQQSLTINGVISDGTGPDTAALHVTGDGTLTLTGANTYRGGTRVVTGGTLAISSDANLGAVPEEFDPDNLQINAGYLRATAGFTITANRGLVVGPLGAMIAVDAGETLTYAGATGSEDPGYLIKTGDGILVLTGENTHVGGVEISGGTLSISSDANLGAVPDQAAANNLVLHGGVLMTTASFTLNANRGIALDEAQPNVLHVVRGETLTFGGIIAGDGDLDKVGDGTLLLIGENTCTGTTTVEAGTLQVDGRLESSAVVVNGGTLAGTGWLGAVTLQTGTLAADSDLGTLHVGSLTAQSTAAMEFDLAESLTLEFAALVDATGSVDLGSSLLAIDADSWIDAGTVILLIAADGGLSGEFANAADGSLIQAVGSEQYFRIHITNEQVVAEAVYHKLGLPGLYDPETSTFYLRDSITGGTATVTFGYGQPGAGWLPVVGDWDGDGVQTIGLYDPMGSVFYLRNSNSGGMADLIVAYGPDGDAGWLPVIGDWTGSGVDTIGLYDPQSATWYLRNANSSGMADITFAYGAPDSTWTPLVGDWNADGVDTIGLYDASGATWHLRNSNSTGVADLTFAFGAADATWTALTGDWTETGLAAVGLFDAQSATWYLRDENSTGCADHTFSFGNTDSDYVPIVGDWIGHPSQVVDARAVDQLDLSALADEALDNPTSLDATLGTLS